MDCRSILQHNQKKKKKKMAQEKVDPKQYKVQQKKNLPLAVRM
jgi:hypothetical protein